MTVIITKNSSTASAVPTSSDLVKGELAVNVADKRLYTEDASANIIEIGINPSSITTTTGTVTGTLTANGTLNSSNAVLTGGTVNGMVIGGSSALAITGTTVTATTGFAGDLTGAVTGNVTGNLQGNVTGNVTGNLTGNVTATSGTTNLHNLALTGTVDFNTARLTDIGTPVSATDAVTKAYADQLITNLIDGAPAALDTLNELAAALDDDAAFHTTVTNSIALKLPLAGGTMSGAIAMGTNKITGAGDPTAAQDLTTKAYVDTQVGGGLPTSGGTMSGAIAMGNNKITGLATPTDSADSTTKAYVDGILGSATSAATSATNAANSASAASTSAGNASTSESNSASSATSSANSAALAAASFDQFDDIYLGAKSSVPSVDNDGNALQAGALYFNTVSNTMFVYSGSSWAAAGSAVNGTAERQEYTATSGQTSFNATYDVGFVDVYLNGSRLVPTTDFTATNGSQIVLTSGATTGDNVGIIAYGAFDVANVYTQAQSNARYAQLSNNLSDLASAPTALTNLGLTATAAELNYVDGVTSNIQTQLNAKGTGTVTSVGGTGAVSGLTLTGAVTGSGNLTLGGSLDDINLASGVTGTLPVANGGTGAATLTANNVLLGNGTSAPLAVAPSTSGNVLTSNGSTWQSTAPAGGSNLVFLGKTTLASNATYITFTSEITQTYNNYEFYCTRINGTNNGSSICMQIQINGSWWTTNGNNAYGVKTASSSIAWVGGNNSPYLYIGVPNYGAATSYDDWGSTYGKVSLQGVKDSAAYTTSGTEFYIGLGSSSFINPYGQIGAFSTLSISSSSFPANTSRQITGIRFFQDTGSLLALSSISVFGVKES